MRYFAAAPASLAPLLETELQDLGARSTRVRGAGVEFGGGLAVAYRACLWSRLASRVLAPIARVPAADAAELYAALRELEWEAHLDPETRFAVHCSTRRARISHSHYAALRLKDALVDRFRARVGRRPDVDPRHPDLRLHLHLRGAEARVYVDLAGESLHRRGYRIEAGTAPLRETLAAALLTVAGWPDAARFQALLDPMCGSGTLLIEAGLMCADAAPGLTRARHGLEAWGGHDAALWGRLLEEARARRERGLASLPALLGSDRDARVVEAARGNAARAGLAGRVRLENRDAAALERGGAPAASGLLACNPPYGTRMDRDAAEHARELLRRLAGKAFASWVVALLLPDDDAWPARDAGRAIAVTNGARRCRIHVLEPRPRPEAVTVDRDGLANRLRKNERRLASWRRREGVSCYRVYDADLPEFAFAIDLYHEGATRWAHVQEYAPPAGVDRDLAGARRDAALEVSCRVLDVDPARAVLKTRRRQRGAWQYPRRASAGRELEVREGDARLLVNLHDYLDTGLFLDHRPIRRWIHDHSAGVRFLNLFAYTGAASVHAAVGGARRTVSVDLSRPYLEWTQRNLGRNGFRAPEHTTVQADCTRWLASAQARELAPFDLVLVDPPTFSNSKRMAGSFDVQRDHVALLASALALTSDHGTVVFSTHRRGFQIERDGVCALGVQLRDWTRPSIPPDFSRARPAHQCFILRRDSPRGRRQSGADASRRAASSASAS